MFSKIIDLLIKQDEERKKIFILFLKIVFTATLSAKIYSIFYGTFSILAVTDVQGISNYFIGGKFVICFAIFYFVWVISYGLFSMLLTFPTFWLTSKLYFIFSELMKLTAADLKQVYTKSNKVRKSLNFVRSFFNSTDIIEYENNQVKPGTNYYKFYDYLLDVEEQRKTIDADVFLSNISLTIQLILINCWLHLNIFSYSIWFLIFSIIVIFFFNFFSLYAYVIATFVDLKHSRLLNYMEKLTPNYKVRQRNKNQTIAS